MRSFLLLLLSFPSLYAAADVPLNGLWDELKVKREALKTYHQEFNVTRMFRTREHTQSSTWPLVLDGANQRWHQVTSGGSGKHIQIYDGEDLFILEEGEEEYLRPKLSTKEMPPLPEAYQTKNLDWSKGVERKRTSCGLSKVDHQCVSLEIPLKSALKLSTTGQATQRVVNGTESVVLDMETGLILSYRLTQVVENERLTYQSDITYQLKSLSYGAAPEDATFRLPPAATKEVKELTHWDAAKMKKQLSGKVARDITLKDLHNNSLTLSSLKGKTVLLDFWTTWCGPCRADSPALEKLNVKYGGKNLAIIGISVDEERSTVEKFLSEHPHTYPIALTTENEMPRAYQIGVFPTYVVIDSDGNFASAAEGTTGFGDLRKLLKKAGLETE